MCFCFPPAERSVLHLELKFMSLLRQKEIGTFILHKLDFATAENPFGIALFV